jgi:hypothetical protein
LVLCVYRVDTGEPKRARNLGVLLSLNTRWSWLRLSFRNIDSSYYSKGSYNRVLANLRSFRRRVSYGRDSSPVIVSGSIVPSFLLFTRLRVFTGHISVAVIVIVLNPLFIVSLLEHVELYRSLIYSLGGITSSGLILPLNIRAIVPNYRGVPSFLYTSLV